MTEAERAAERAMRKIAEDAKRASASVAQSFSGQSGAGLQKTAQVATAQMQAVATQAKQTASAIQQSFGGFQLSGLTQVIQQAKAQMAGLAQTAQQTGATIKQSFGGFQLPQLNQIVTQANAQLGGFGQAMSGMRQQTALAAQGFGASMGAMRLAAATTSQSVSRSFAQMNKNVTGSIIDLDKLFNRGFGLQSLVAQSISVFSAVAAVKGIINLTDEFKLLENRLTTVVDSTSELRRTQTELFDVAQRTRQEYAAVTDLYIRVAQASNELGASQSELLRFTEATGNAFAIAGTNAERARGVMIQLTQGISGGTFRAEEFNSVLEGAAPLIRIVAQNIERFRGSVGALRLAVREGKVSSAEFFDAVVKGSDQLQKIVASMPVTVSQAFTQLKNVFTQAILQADISPLADSITEIKDLIGDPEFQRNMTALVDVLLQLTALSVKGLGTFANDVSNILTIIRGLGDAIRGTNDEIERFLDLLGKLPGPIGALAKNLSLLKDVDWSRFLPHANELRIIRGLLDLAARELSFDPAKFRQSVGGTTRGRYQGALPTDQETGKPDKEAENAREAILKQIQALEQQRAVLGKTAAATMAYRIAFGDLAETFRKAGPGFEKYKQILIDSAAALEQATAVQAIEKEIESLTEQAATLNLTEEAAFEYSLAHGEMAKNLEKAGEEQARLTEEYRKAWRELQRQKDLQTIVKGMADVERQLLEAMGKTVEAAALARQEQFKDYRDALDRIIAAGGGPAPAVEIPVQVEATQASQTLTAIGKQIEGLKAGVTIPVRVTDTGIVEFAEQSARIREEAREGYTFGVQASGVEEIIFETKRVKDEIAAPVTMPVKVEITVEQAQEARAKLDKLMKLGEISDEIKRINTDFERIREEYSRQEQTIETQVTTGVLSEIGARKELIRIHQEQARELLVLREAYQTQLDAARALGGDLPEVARQIAEIDMVLLQLTQTTNEFRKIFADAFESGMGDALFNLATGVSSLEDAAKEFLRGINEEILRWASDEVASAVRDKLFGKDGVLAGAFSEGGIFGKLGGMGGLGGAAQSAFPIYGKVAGAAGVATGAAGAVAGAAETTAMATAITTAGTAAAASITTASATMTTSLTTAGSTVAAAITTAGTAAAAAIRAAAVAGGSGAGLSTLIEGFNFSGIGFAKGGALSRVPFAVAAGQGLARYAGGGPLDVFSGGLLRGPGTPTSDSMLLLGSTKEFMVQAKAAQQPGAPAFLDAFNRGTIRMNDIVLGLEAVRIKVPRFAEGGTLSRPATSLPAFTAPPSHADDAQPQPTLLKVLSASLVERHERIRRSLEELSYTESKRSALENLRQILVANTQASVTSFSQVVERVVESLHSTDEQQTFRVANREVFSELARLTVSDSQLKRVETEQRRLRQIDERRTLTNLLPPLAMLLGKADGAFGAPLVKRAGGGALDVRSGGLLYGPGTPTSDSLLLLGSRDEFMVQAKAVQQPGGRQFLDAYNTGQITLKEIRLGLQSIGRLPRFASGGSLSGVNPTVVSGPTVTPISAGGGREPRVINQYLTVQAPGGHVSRQTEMNTMAAAARGLKIADTHNN